MIQLFSTLKINQTEHHIVKILRRNDGAKIVLDEKSVLNFPSDLQRNYITLYNYFRLERIFRTLKLHQLYICLLFQLIELKTIPLNR